MSRPSAGEKLEDTGSPDSRPSGEAPSPSPMPMYHEKVATPQGNLITDRCVSACRVTVEMNASITSRPTASARSSSLPYFGTAIIFARRGPCPSKFTSRASHSSDMLTPFSSKITALMAVSESMACAALSASMPNVRNFAPPAVMSRRDAIAPSTIALSRGTGASV